jgi:hypothetical protein
MKYPLDQLTFTETVSHLIENYKTQNALLQKVCTLLEEAMDDSENDDSEWDADSEQLLKDLHSLKMYHESRRFNEDNFRSQFGYEPTEKMSDALGRIGVRNMEYPEEEVSEEVGEMSEEELAKMFKEKRKTKKSKEPEKSIKKMTMEEILAWEAKQDNSNDIYKIKARIANLARGPGMSLTPQGEILCNSFVHMLKALYEFTENKVTDPELKISLVQLIRQQESVPGTIIAAAGAGVHKSKKDIDKE